MTIWPTCDLVRATSVELTPVTAVHITDQHAHGDGNVGDGSVAGAYAIGHVHKRNRDSLDVGHGIEIDGDLRRPFPLKLVTCPVPEVTIALPTVTELAKLMII